MKIYDFKKGDIITRIEPSIESDDFKNYTLIGEKLVFLGIANASIYLSQEINVMLQLFMMGKADNKRTIQLPVELWENGWALYEEPDFLLDQETSSPSIEEENYLKRQIEKAIDSDNYEKAVSLKKKLDKLLKNKKDGSN